MEELLWCPERREWAFHLSSSQKRKVPKQPKVAQQNNKTNKTNCAIQNKNNTYNGQKI